MKIKKLTEQEVNDIIKKDSLDLSTFQIQTTLEPNIFDKDEYMYPEIRNRLLMIADDFFESLNIGWVDISDITLTGSLANYNWSKYSDVDLHIILDYNDVDENQELVEEYFDSKTTVWNDRHDITIKGYDVELYVQDSNIEHYSSGVYSILWDGWVVKPDNKERSIDVDKVKQKVNGVVTAIKGIYRMYKAGDYDKTIRMIDNTKKKLKKMRQSGLDREGEYSFENIAFKVLRRTGYLGKLFDMKNKSYNKSLTFKENFKLKNSNKLK